MSGIMYYSAEAFLTYGEQMAEEEDKSQMEKNMRVVDNLARIKHKVVVMSGKGGVGKSTVAVNLALMLAETGKKVGVMDVDIHGPDVAMLLGVQGQRLQSTGDMIVPVKVKENLSAISMAFLLEDRDTPVVWRGPLKMSAIQQFLGEVAWGDLDYLIIDSPPGTGDEPLTVAQLIKDARAVIVTTPQEVALADVRKSINFCKTVKMEILGLVENMSGFICPHCGKPVEIFGSGGGERTAALAGLKLLGKIPFDPNLVTCGDAGISYQKHHADAPASRVFDEIAAQVVSASQG